MKRRWEFIDFVSVYPLDTPHSTSNPHESKLWVGYAMWKTTTKKTEKYRLVSRSQAAESSEKRNHCLSVSPSISHSASWAGGWGGRQRLNFPYQNFSELAALHSLDVACTHNSPSSSPGRGTGRPQMVPSDQSSCTRVVRWDVLLEQWLSTVGKTSWFYKTLVVTPQSFFCI